MPISLGDTDVTETGIGGTDVARVSLGDDLIHGQRFRSGETSNTQTTGGGIVYYTNAALPDEWGADPPVFLNQVRVRAVDLSLLFTASMVAPQPFTRYVHGQGDVTVYPTTHLSQAYLGDSLTTLRFIGHPDGPLSVDIQGSVLADNVSLDEAWSYNLYLGDFALWSDIVIRGAGVYHTCHFNMRQT